MTIATLDQPAPSSERPIDAATQSGRARARRYRLARQGLIGIDIGTRFVKIAQVVTTGRTVSIRTAELIDLNQHHVAAQNADLRIGPILRNAIVRAGFEGRDAAILLPTNRYREQDIEIDFENDLSIQRQAAGRFAGGTDESAAHNVVRCWTTSSHESGGKNHVEQFRAVAISERTVADTVTDLQHAGIRVSRLEAPSMVAAQLAALQQSQDRPADGVAILDWGDSAASVTLVSHGVPVFSRVLRDSSYGYVVEQTSRGLDISLNAARVLLARYGLPGKSDGDGTAISRAVFDAVHAPLSMLAAEIRRTKDYLENRCFDRRPTQIVLTGGGSCLKNFAGWLSPAVLLPVHRWSPPALDGTRCAPFPAALFANAIALSQFSAVAKRS